MSHLNQYGNYYDPVGSQASRPSGYSYSASPSTAAYQTATSSSGYGSSYRSNYQRAEGDAYSTQQQYRSNTSQQAATSATHAAAALSSLSNQEYAQGTSGTRTSANNQYDNNYWYPVNGNSNVYSGNSMQVPNRTQSNNSPLYPTAQSSSTFGRLSIPEQTQSSSNTFRGSQPYQNTDTSSAASNPSYQTADTQQQQTQPQRYKSPLHAVQAQQHGHGKQSSRNSNHLPSPQMAQLQSTQQDRQQSASVEPSPMTVDPSQVYDNRAELQRKVQVEAEERRKLEADQAAKRAEEERIAEQKRKEEEAKKAEQEAAAKKAEQERKNAQRRKAREEKKQSKSAATTLQQMALSMAEAESAGDGEDESQMRAMFQKMREFNSKNPALLAKLWDEERKSHEASKGQSPQQPSAAAGSSTTAVPTSPTATKGGKAPTKFAQAQAQAKSQTAALNAISSRDQPAAQQKSQKPLTAPVANTSLWPPHKKSSLSEATAKWLNAMPQNAKVYVAPGTVLSILNDNPSYVELCRSLENLGLKFDRSQLARELLKAVPDGLKPQSAIQPSTALTMMSGTASHVTESSASPGTSKGRGRARKDSIDQGPVSGTPVSTVNYEAPLSLSDAAREVNSMHRPSYQSTYVAPQQPLQSPQVTQSQTVTNGSRPPSQSKPSEIKQEVKPEEPPKPPADKEEAARKRTFGDLVDLTADDSDDEPPPKKVMQAPPAAINGLNNRSQFSQQPTTFNHFMHRPGGQTLATSPYFPAPSNGPLPPAPVGGQQLQFPARPTPPPSKSKGPTPEQLQQTRLRGKMLVEPIMRDRVARKSNYDSRTIARDVLLATGRHPDMRGLNAHLANMHKLLGAHGGEFDTGGNRSDLSTIKWDVIDPKPAKETREIPQRVARADSTEQEPRPPIRDSATTNSLPKFGSPPISEDRLIKRPRGRPPRQSLPSTLTNSPASPANSTSNMPHQQTPSRPTTSSSAPAPDMSSGAAVGYAAFAQINPDGTKKKGRPFGWKKNVHSREALGLPKAVSHAPTPSKLKQSTTAGGGTVAQEKEVRPQYQEYKCRWDGCSSSLMNLETLKKHIVKIHGKENERGEYMCWWTDCKGVKRPGLGAGRVPAKYDKIEEWMKHVDEAHVKPIMWKLGDGPKGGVAYETSHFYNSETPPPYLSDSRGRSVTPIILPPIPIRQLPAQSAADTDTMTSPQQQPTAAKRGRPPKHGGVPKTTVAGSEGTEKDPELSKLAEHQRLVGPLMDRTGCILASEERRTTFLDDEDFQDECWGSDHDMRQ